MDRVHCTLSRVACDVGGVLVCLLLDSYFSWDVVFLSFAYTFLYYNAMFGIDYRTAYLAIGSVHGEGRKREQCIHFYSV